MRFFAFKTLFLFFLFLGASISAIPAFGQHTPEGPFVRYALVPEKTTIAPGEEILIGIAHTIAPHWHVYWLNPGDSGLPVRTKWALPEGFVIEDLKWPIPDKIYEGELANYGYYGQITLLQTLRAPQTLPAGVVELPVKITVLVCKDICIPESAELTLRLNDSQAPAQDNSALIKAAQAKLPTKISGDFSFSRADTKNEKRFALTLALKNPTVLNNLEAESVEFYPEEWGVLDYPAKPSVQIKNGTLTLTHKTLADRDWADLESVKGVLVYTDASGTKQGYALEAKKIAGPLTTAKTSLPPDATPAPASMPEKASTGLFLAIILAVLGGLILNLMPCVFPVLSMKALSLVKMSEKHPEVARQHGLAYTAGVILSFLVVGISLLVLKEAGSAIGWGFQLQSPVVVGLLAYLLFAIGLNLMGFFEFGNGLGNIGNRLTQKNNTSGSFFTGVLATIVATPCTAPFMGAALGFALVQPALVAITIFIALGFGLALPYLLLSFVPPLRGVFPKPGPWMDSFKQLLSFPMFASAIWLVWVISQQSGPEGVLVTLLGMLSFALAVWLSHRSIKSAVASWILRLSIALLILIPVTSLAYMKTKAEDVACLVKTYDFGEHFTPAKLAHELEGNKPVFVEMTAAWCITCKANHASSIGIPSTRTLFDLHNVTYLIGDWTNYNEEITTYLEKHGRNGVPLYVFYGAKNPATGKRPAPKVLPQVLTPTIVQNAIEGKI